MKRFLLFLFLAVVYCGYVMAYDFSAVCGSGQTLYYNITSSISPYTVEVTKENASSPYYNTFPTGSLTIPSAVTYNGNTYNVTSIGGYAFYGCTGLTSVTISNSVTSIGICAFDGCSGLTSVTIPNSVKEILRLAFYNSGLTSINIPSSVTYIGDGAFQNTRWFNNRPNGILYSSDWCLGYKGDKPTGSLVINEGTKGIIAKAFYSCTGITSVVIPNSVTSIGEYAFRGCSISEPVYNDNCFAYFPCGYATEYTIPDGIRQISGAAFYNCSDIISVTMPNSVTSIDMYAFRGCTGLTSVTLPDSLTKIGLHAFINCSGLTSVTIGNLVESIGESAFGHCDNLEAVYYTGTIAQWCEITFGDKEANPLYYAHNLYINNNIVDDLVIPDAITEIKPYSFWGASCLTSVSIHNSVTNISNTAFVNCSGVETIVVESGNTTYDSRDDCNAIIETATNILVAGCMNTIIPNSVTGIGERAFYGCSGLTSVTIPNLVTSIGGHAFRDCSGLTSVTIPNSVTNIEKCTFYGCSGLISVTIPNSVTAIGSLAFYGCSGLTSVTIGNSIEGIGNEAFNNCNGLTDIYANPTTPPYQQFDDTPFFTNYDATLWVPCGSVAAYSAADVWSNFSDIREHFAYELNVSSANSQQGTTSITQQPNCSDGIAIITAEPATHYNFVSWNDGNTDNPRTITIESDTTFTANFAIDQFTVTVVSANETLGTVSGSGTFAYGTETQISATAAEHYHFVSWNDGNTANPRTITIESDSTFTATFAIDQFTITVVSANETMGTVSGSGTFAYGTETQISAIANEHYHFVQWTDGDTNNPRTITVIADATYTATFNEDVTNYTITAVSANPSQGIVTGGGTYPEGTVVTLTATANEGYQFLQWSDNSTENPRQITVTNDAVYVASFTEAVATYTITVVSANPSQGSVTGGGTYQEGAVATLTATANEGYRFLSWSDNSTENPHYITVTEDAMYIATFEVDNSQQSIYVTINETACGSYTWNDSTYTQSGEYQQTFTATTSVDSIVTLVLEIFPLPEPEITATGILDACNPSSVMLSAGNYSAYNWNTGESTEAITISEPGNYYVEVVDGHGCHGYSEMLEVGYSNTLTEAPQLKRVGMSNTGTNIIQWTVANTEGIAGFEIYREDNIANVYTLIQRIDRPGVRSCTDLTANPSARAYRYKICAVDECGGLSPLSEPHKTMHLTINRGLGNTWNLIWSPYEGMEFASYKIYRGSTIQNMVVIGEVPSTMNTFTDSDNPACAGFFYKVVIVANTRSDDEDEMLLGSNIVDNGLMPEYTITAVSANPNQGTVVGGGTYPEGSLVALAAIPTDGYEFLSWSDESTENPHYITVTGNAVYVATFVPATDIKDNALPEIALFPNPAKDILNITSSETISEIEIANVMGQVVKRIEVNSDNAVCNVEDLTSGVYVVRIHAASTTLSQQKFVKD